MGKVVDSIFGSKVTQSQNAATPVAQAFTQSQNAYANGGGGLNDVIGKLLAGQPGDPTSTAAYFQHGLNSTGMVQNPGQSTAIFNPQQINGTYNAQQGNAVFNPTQLNSQYTAPGFQGTNLNPVQTGMAQNVQAPNINLQQGPNVLQGMGQQANLQNVVNPTNQAANLQAIMQNQQNSDIANLRERFGNQALSSGAQLAESNYRAQAAPQTALALNTINQQNTNQALTQRAQDLQNFQGTQGNDTSRLGLGVNQAQGLNNSSLGLSAQGLQASQGNQNAALQQQGLNNTANLGLNDQMLNQNNQLNTFNQNNAQFGANFGQQNNQLNNQNNLAAVQAAMQQQGINNQNNQFEATFGQNAGQLNNQFAQQLAAMMQGNQQFNTNTQLQNQGLGNQFNLGMQNVGLGMQGNQLNAQNMALQQIMQNLRQTQGLGVPQAENVVTPGWGTQLLNAGGQIAGMVSGFGNQNFGAQPNIMPQNSGQFQLPSNLQSLPLTYNPNMGNYQGVL